MNPAIEVRKTPDGRIQARRKDGKPLSAEDREQAKKLAETLGPVSCNCGAPTVRTQDIYGRHWWACWACAKWA